MLGTDAESRTRQQLFQHGVTSLKVSPGGFYSTVYVLMLSVK